MKDRVGHLSGWLRRAVQLALGLLATGGLVQLKPDIDPALAAAVMAGATYLLGVFTPLDQSHGTGIVER